MGCCGDIAESCSSLSNGLSGGYRLFYHAAIGPDRQPWAIGYLIFAFLMLGVSVALDAYNSFLFRDWLTALNEKDSDAYYSKLLFLMGFHLATVPVNTFRHYIIQRLAVGWRDWLAHKFIQRYFENRNYLTVGNTDIDNPDQRLTDDIKNLTVTGTELMEAVVLAVFNTVIFGIILIQISAMLFGVLVAYTACGTILTGIIFGPPLVRITFDTLRLEADLRFGLIRVQENAESIAFYKGEAEEQNHILAIFRLVLDIIKEGLLWMWALGAWLQLFFLMIAKLPILLVAPQYLSGKVKYGVIAQTTIAFRQVYGSLAVLVNKAADLSRLAAEVKRVNALAKEIDLFQTSESGDPTPPHDTTDKRDGGSSGGVDHGTSTQKSNTEGDVESEENHLIVNTEGSTTGNEHTDQEIKLVLTDGDLRLENLIVRTPKHANSTASSEVLVTGLSLQVVAGESLLIMGGSGCGKTSLLRAISGLWSTGSGTIHCPSDTLFVPQSPYMIIGTLRAQLLYPHLTSEEVPDDKLLEMLKFVHLDLVAGRVGGLDAELNWKDTLSIGEQQRIAFARLFLHKPKISFLDEASSALDQINEEHLYSHLSSLGCSYISIGHRHSIVKHHTQVINFSGPGQHTLDTREEFMQRMRDELAT